jgi:hypothetical protein
MACVRKAREGLKARADGSAVGRSRMSDLQLDERHASRLEIRSLDTAPT